MVTLLDISAVAGHHAMPAALLLTVFQAYQEDRSVIMEAFCKGTPFTVEKNSSHYEIRIPAGQALNYLLIFRAF